MTQYSYDYPRPALSVDIVVFTLQENRLQVLMIERGHPPYQGMWALPGGFVEIDESLEAAAHRELFEETGVTDAYLEQLYTYGEPDRDPRGRVITVAYFSLIPSGAQARLDGGDDARQAKWFPINKQPKLAFDHQEIIAYAYRRLKYKIEYSAAGFQLLPEYFTLTEIQRTYEIILGEKLDKRNFRRRILQAEIIEETKQFRSGDGRPARLYRYRDDAVAEIKTRRLFP